jgi:uncharacterized protein YfaP (DUF2135 family)
MRPLYAGVVLVLSVGALASSHLSFAAGRGEGDEPESRDRPEIADPRAGWRAAEDGARFLQRVNYPASSVNTEEASSAALIAGHLAATPKGGATLVVNGVAMPLRVEENGRFARPYAFSRGSNSVEVRADGARVRRQFFETRTGQAQAKLRVVLSWDTDATDVDLHVVTPLGEHAYYGERVVPSGGAIDVDVTTGFGPEIFAHPSPAPGTYHVYVNYYGAGETLDDLTVAQVAIITGEGTAQERLQTFQVPLRKPGELTLVRSFAYP